jgi:DNA-binding transcriptional MerR regulator
MKQMSIGALARRAGVSVRTLHHYDAAGLLTPRARARSGARRYGQQDLIRLHRILVLKQWGYSLADIGLTLDDASACNVSPIPIKGARARGLGLAGAAGNGRDLPAAPDRRGSQKPASPEVGRCCGSGGAMGSIDLGSQDGDSIAAA